MSAPAAAPAAKNLFRPYRNSSAALKEIIRFGPDYFSNREFKMLVYFAERICTWQNSSGDPRDWGKESDDSSFGQMVSGIYGKKKPGKPGKLWRAGCGLSKASACRAIRELGVKGQSKANACRASLRLKNEEKGKGILTTERPDRDGEKGDLPTRYRIDWVVLHKYLEMRKAEDLAARESTGGRLRVSA